MESERFEPWVEKLLDDAREAATRRDWSAVGALARSALALDPESEDAERLLEDSRSASTGTGEWRQLTLMFCDVVGSTTLADKHDPEVFRDVLRSYQTTTHAVVGRYDGHVANYIGDGVLVYFGYPTPHEDDARRAVKAGIDLLAAVHDVAADARQRHGFELELRAAIHTGKVVRAEMGPPESPDRDAVVGELPNVAARLQDSARPGTLVISGDTHRLVQGFFLFEPLGRLELRGVARPVDAYEVLGETPVAGRLEAQGELSPFVNRHGEIEHLSALWRQAVEGGSSVAAIRGEPGIGKSRLVGALLAQVIGEESAALSFRCSTFHATTHLYPARRLVAEVCHIDLAAADLSGVVPRLGAMLVQAGLERHLPLFGALLGVAPGPECPAPELDGHMLREATLAALVEWIEAEAARSPRLLAVDDVQWADPSTLELLDRLIARQAPRLLVLLTSRSKFELRWESIEVLELGPLGEAELDLIAAASPAGRRLAPGQVEELVRRSDGVPLFFEELLRVEGQPSGAPAPRPARRQTAIPPALLDPLLARLAAPGVNLGLIQTVACIGQECRLDLLAAVAGLADEELRAGLEGLVAAGLLDRDEGEEPTTYRFRHQLLRELAYDTQLTPPRMERHGRIADALRPRLGRDQPADAGRLAQHFEHAGRTGEAVVAYVEAAQIAQLQGAFAEATEILDHALKLVAGVADEQARLTLELTVRRALGFSKVATLGYAAPEAVHEHERCFEIYQALEAGPEHMPDLIPVWSYYLLKGDLGRAEEVISVERRRIGTAGADEPPEELFTGFNRYFRGDVTGAVADLESYLDSDYAHQPGTPSRWPLPNDPTVAAWTLLSLATYLRGDPTVSRTAIAKAEARAAELPFPWGPFSTGFAKAYGYLVRVQAGDYAAADADLVELLEVAERHGFMFFTLYGQLQDTIAGLRPGATGGPEAVTQALALWRVAGGELWVPAFLTRIAMHQLEGGDPGVARASLREAEAISGRSGARFWAAEMARVLGESKLAAGDAAGVEDLREAVEIAAEQGALVFELRARTALSRAVQGRDELDGLAGLVGALGDRPGLPELAVARQALSAGPPR